MQTNFSIDSKWLLCVALLLWQGIAFAQTPYISWQKSLGGDSTDYANDIQQTTDGGYIMAGSTRSINGDITWNHGSSDAWVVKLDVTGNISWEKSLGGSDWDEANAIQQTTDGGYIIAGYSRSLDGDVTGNHGSDDYWVVKLTANGDIDWQKSLGGSHQDWAYTIQQTTDGGYIVAGWSSSINGDVIGNHGNHDSWIVKLDSSGNLSWQKCLGGIDYEEVRSIKQTTDGDYIVAGYSKSNNGDVTGNHGNYDSWIVKLGANGTLDWQKCFGGSDFDGATSMQQTTDGGYIVAGNSYSTDGNVTGNHGKSDYWVVKLAANGNLTWQQNFGGSNWDDALAVEQTTEGGYIVTGSSMSIDGQVTGNHGSWDYWVVKLKPNGTLEWEKSLGGSGDEWAFSIRQTTDGGYVVAGLGGYSDGDVTGNHGDSDAWIVKLGIYGVGIEEANNTRDLRVWTNPDNSMSINYYLSSATEVEMRMVDVLGNGIAYVETERETEGEHSRIIEVGHLASGLYFLELRTAYGRETVRWVKE